MPRTFPLLLSLLPGPAGAIRARLSHIPAGSHMVRVKDDLGHLAYAKLVRVP